MRYFLLMLVTAVLFTACASNSTSTKKESTQTASIEAVSVNQQDPIDPSEVYDGNPIVKSDEEWKKELSKAEYDILRNHGTEARFSGDLLDIKKEGVYSCAACQLPLFSSTTKFESGTGWPSFWQPIHKKNVGETVDNSYGMSRVEVHCNRCNGHLGHVFKDGPRPTGLRYCINSVSLDFEEAAPLGKH